MTISASSTPIQDGLQRLSAAIGDIVESLRVQRDVLRQRGMSLPPGTLDGFHQAQQRVLEVSQQLAQEANELTRLRALAATIPLINSSLDVDQVLNEVMDTVIALSGAERGYIVLRDEQSGQMVFRIARNRARETMSEDSFIVSRTIVQHVAESGQPVLSTDIGQDPTFGGSESIVMHALRSILCVPLILKDQVTGVVYVDNRIKNAVFGNRELALLVDFANQAAIAIDNARLFRRVQTALADITEMKELMDNVFASIASGVITTDERDLVTTYNMAAERIFGTPLTSVLGSPLPDALPPVFAYVRDYFDAVFQHGIQELLEVVEEVPQRGEVNLNLKLTPLKNAGQTEGVAIVVDDLTEIKRRDATLNIVRRYLPPAMVDNIQSIDELGLGGERREISVVFVESRPFSAYPPHLDPQSLMELLNLYLTSGADAIHVFNGVIDKFMGNEIMGLFNTQLNPSPEHAWLAVQSALKIVDEYTALSSRLGESSAPYYRVGVHCGEATMGNVGSTSRREFTAIGHTVNLAKRLQENAQPGQVIISDAVYRICADRLHDPANQILVVERDSIQVKGVSRATAIFELQRAPR